MTVARLPVGRVLAGGVVSGNATRLLWVRLAGRRPALVLSPKGSSNNKTGRFTLTGALQIHPGKTAPSLAPSGLWPVVQVRL